MWAVVALQNNLAQINQPQCVNYYLNFQVPVASFPLGPQGQLITSNFGGLRFVKVVTDESPLGSAAVLKRLVCSSIGGGAV